jgi:WD40 repeat protein
VGAATELRRVADWSLVATLSGDTPLFSPDGQTVVTQLGKPNPTMMLWRTDGEVLARVPGEQAVAFSPDGTLLATRSGAKVLVRRSADGTSLRELDGSGPAFSPDGTLLALLSPDGADVQIWSAGDIVRARQPAMRLASRLKPAKSEGALAFSADGQSLTAAISGEPISGGPPSALRVWRLTDGSLSVQRECMFCEQHLSRYGTFTVEIQFPNGIGSVVTEIKRTADGQTLSSFESFTINSGTFTGRTLRFSADKTIGVADLELALQEEGVPFHLELPGFEAIGYTPDAQTLIGAGPDLTLWDVTTGALRVWHKPLKAIWEGGPVPPTYYRLLGRVVVAEWYVQSQPLSVTAMAWDAQTGEELWQAHTPETLPGSPVLAWAFSTDGSYALAQGTQARLYPRAGAPQVIAMTSTVSALDFSPDGAALAVGDKTGQVQIMAAGDAKNIGGLRLPGGAVAGLAFSPDSKRLAVFDQKGDVTLLRSLDDQAPATISGGQALWGVTFSPDGTALGLQSQSGSILVWRDAPGAAPARLQGAPTSALTFSYDNQILLVAEESSLAIYRLADGALLRRLDGTARLSAIGPRRRLIGLLRDGLVEQWGVR